jgi:hypothetical protein
VKDNLGEKNPDVCNIPDKRQVKGRHKHICLTWPDQSALAEHSFSVEQHLQLQDTKTVTFHTMLHGPEHQGGDT